MPEIVNQRAGVAARAEVLPAGDTPWAPLMAFWSEAITLAVIFLIYSNAVVVGIRFYGVPWVAGAAVPLLLLVPIAYYLVVRRERLIVGPVVPLIVVMLGIQMAGLLVSRAPDVSLRVIFVSATEGLLLYLLLINAVRTPGTLRRAVWVLLLIGIVLGGLALYQQLTGNFGNQFAGFAQVKDASPDPAGELPPGVFRNPRVCGPVGEINRFAQIMAMLLPLAFMQFSLERSWRMRLLALVAMVLITIAVAMTLSRGAAVGIVLMVIVLVAMREIRLRHAAMIALTLAGLTLLVPQYRQRLTSFVSLAGAMSNRGATLSQADGSIRSRITEMGAAALAFADNPILGVGPGMFPYHYRQYADQVGVKTKLTRRRAHCLYLEVAAETGVVGVMCFIAILLVTLRHLAKARGRLTRKRSPQAKIVTAFLLSILCYMFTGLFLHLAYVRFFWLMMALAWAACWVGEEGVRSEE